MAFKTPSLVKESSTATGSGATFVIDGAAVSHRTFAAAGISTTGADTFPYVIRMGSEFEFGIGTINPAGTLNRTVVIESSNGGIGGSRVTWGAGTKDVYVGFAGADKTPGYHGFNKTVKPYTGVSTADGYGPGSLWVQEETYADASVQRTAYLCVDNESGTTTQFVAIGMNGFGPLFEPTFTDPAKFGVGLGYFDDVVLTKETVGVVGVGNGGKGRWPVSLLQGLGWASGGDYGCHQAVYGGATQTTVNNTPVVMLIGGETGAKLTIEPDSTLAVEGTLVARDNVAGDSALYTFAVLIERNGSADPTIVAGGTPTAVHEDDASWAFTLSIDTTDDALVFNVTGDATNPTRFTLSFKATQAAFT